MGPLRERVKLRLHVAGGRHVVERHAHTRQLFTAHPPHSTDAKAGTLSKFADIVTPSRKNVLTAPHIIGPVQQAPGDEWCNRYCHRRSPTRGLSVTYLFSTNHSLQKCSLWSKFPPPQSKSQTNAVQNDPLCDIAVWVLCESFLAAVSVSACETQAYIPWLSLHSKTSRGERLLWVKTVKIV